MLVYHFTFAVYKLRRQLAWNAQAKSIEQHIGEQYLELPALFVLLMEHLTRVKKAMLLIFWRHDMLV